MTAHEQPISYLDSILNEEESRCEYSHQWRNFTISRSGRFKSKNRKRDAVDGKLFDAGNAPNMMSAKSSMSSSSSSSPSSSSPAAIAGHSRVMTPATMNPHYKQELDKNTFRQTSSAMSNKLFSSQSMPPSAYANANSRNTMMREKSYYNNNNNNSNMREKTESYKSYYETNL